MRYLIGITAAICTALGLWAAAPGARADAQADCSQGKDLELRIRGCSEVIAGGDAFTYYALYRRGEAYRAKGEHDRAIADFSAVIGMGEGGTLRDDDIVDLAKRSYAATAYAARSIAYMLKGDSGRALADFSEAIKREPRIDYVFVSLPDGGLAYLNEIISLKPDEAVAYAFRAGAYVMKGDMDRAIADLSEAIERAPSVAWFYRDRALWYIGRGSKGDHDRAIADYGEVIKLKPDAAAYGQRGRALADFKRDYDRAIADLSEAIRRDVRDYSAFEGRAKAYAAKGDHDRAIADVSEAIGLRNKGIKSSAYELRADFHLAKGDYDGAIADYDRAIADIEAPRPTGPLVSLGMAPHIRAGFVGKRANAYYLKRDYARAIADYSESLKGTLLPGRAYLGRARTYTAAGDYDRAIGDYSKAIAVRGNGADYYVRSYIGRASAYLKAGKASQGLPDAEHALKLRPEHPGALNARGHILEAMGNREGAIADFRKALQLDPTQQASQEALKRLGATP